jgi:predicted nucleic acid-binding protein
MNVVIDSSVLVALLASHDQWHEQAKALWQAIKDNGHVGLYLDCVVAETASTATRRLREKRRYDEVADLLNRLEAEITLADITWVLPDVPALYPNIMALIRDTAGELNFNDALIALACRERDIPAIASFDLDFDRLPWLRRLARPEEVSA